MQTIARWDVLVPKPHTFRDSHVLIYSFNTISLFLHKNDVLSNYNIKTTHILCFNETHFDTLTFNNTSLNIDTKTHSMINVNGRNGTMIIYDNFTTLSSHETFTSLGLNILQQHSMQIQERLFIKYKHYRPSTLSLSMFIIHLQKFLDLMPISCPMIIIGNFNINMFDQNSTPPNELQSFIDQYSIKFQFKKITTIYGSYIDHICTNAPLNNACQELLKLIGLSINQYILHSNLCLTKLSHR